MKWLQEQQEGRFGISHIIVLAFLLTFIVVSCLNSMKESERQCAVKHNIAQLQVKRDLSGYIRGSFFLGIGSISGSMETKPFYYFYEIEPGGSLRLRHIEHEKIRIFQDENVAPYYTKCWESVGGGKGVEMYTLHIPPNSIKYETDYRGNLDIENL